MWLKTDYRYKNNNFIQANACVVSNTYDLSTSINVQVFFGRPHHHWAREFLFPHHVLRKEKNDFIKFGRWHSNAMMCSCWQTLDSDTVSEFRCANVSVVVAE